MNQAMLYEFPQGDPYSGPAYGDKHKSKGLGMVLGVVASVTTMGAAAPLLAGTTIASQIAGGAMMAGGVLSGVGAVTGNKKLMKVGGVLALAGGLGNVAASGLGIGQAAGSGSQAVSQFSTNFMESANNLGIGEFYSPDTIAGAKDAASRAFGGEAAAEAGGGILNSAEVIPIKLADVSEVPLSGGAEGPMTDASMDTINLADAGMDSNMRAVQNKAPGILSNAEAGGGAGVEMDSNMRAVQGDAFSRQSPAVTPPKESSMLKDTLGFIKENPEATKIGAGMLEQAMAAAGNDDQVSALIDRYKAEANLLTTRNDLEKYKLANAGKQVAMISADDPELDAKVKQATAGGIPVAFIPAIGKNYTPYSKNFTPVARNATYSQPTA